MSSPCCAAVFLQRQQILAEAITPKIPSDPVKKCEFYQLDKYYVPADVFLWAKHNFKKFPDFSKCLLSSRILTDEDLLASSRYWSTLQENMINALQDYPEWKANNPGARWTDEVIGWIKTKYEVNDREADLIKTVLKEIFDRK